MNLKNTKLNAFKNLAPFRRVPSVKTIKIDILIKETACLRD